MAPVTFLLVDDLNENLLALEGLLRRDGLELLQARSGPEALELLLVHDVALAIVDVQMPGMDGFELAELMRGTERTRRVPLVFLTAGGIDEQRRFRGYEAGAVDFLFKPVDPHTLRSKAGVFFELERQRQEVRAVAQANARLLEESRRAAEALRQSEAQLRELNETLEQRVEARTAEVQARNDELQQFAYVASHDFQEPLRKIQTFGSLLLLEAGAHLDGDARTYVERMQAAAARMSSMLHDMLAFSRVSSRATPFARTNVAEVIGDVLLDLELNVAEAGARIDVDADGMAIDADENQLRQVFTHLLLNALKYRASDVPPHIQIAVTTEAPSPADLKDGGAGEYVRIVVADNGIGFEAKYAERIFRPFERLHGKSAYPGTGMGLAIARRIVVRHGGTLTAEGTPGAGSRFTVLLPAHPVAA